LERWCSSIARSFPSAAYTPRDGAPTGPSLHRKTPPRAWEFHKHPSPDSPAKPIRIGIEAGDSHLLNPNVMRDKMRDYAVAREGMASALADKGYRYQFVFARNAGHADEAVRNQTLPEALEYL